MSKWFWTWSVKTSISRPSVYIQVRLYSWLCNLKNEIQTKTCQTALVQVLTGFNQFVSRSHFWLVATVKKSKVDWLYFYFLLNLVTKSFELSWIRFCKYFSNLAPEEDPIMGWNILYKHISNCLIYGCVWFQKLDILFRITVIILS